MRCSMMSVGRKIAVKTHNIYLSTTQFDPAPAATPQRPNPRPSVRPGTFTIPAAAKISRRR